VQAVVRTAKHMSGDIRVFTISGSMDFMHNKNNNVGDHHLNLYANRHFDFFLLICVENRLPF
jgi:hypothetical protein